MTEIRRILIPDIRGRELAIQLFDRKTIYHSALGHNVPMDWFETEPHEFWVLEPTLKWLYDASINYEDITDSYEERVRSMK